jgi:hypothetical protein
MEEKKMMTDAELIDFVTDFREGILDGSSSEGYCYMICAPLVTLLNMNGVKAEMVGGDFGEFNHFWLKLEDGRVLDPTADQFNAFGFGPMPRVYLGPPTENIHPNPPPLVNHGNL